MQHVGLFIKAYIDKVCPQAQVRTFMRDCPVHGRHWEIDIVCPDEVCTRQSKYIMQDSNFIVHFCNTVLTSAGYDLQTLKQNEEDYLVEGN